MGLSGDACGGICCLGIAALVCLIIGLPTYLVGCNETLYPGGCVAYTVKEGVVRSTSTDEETCQECTTIYTGETSTVVCIPYTCYGAFVQWDLCEEKLGTWSSSSDAQNAADIYHCGTRKTVWVTKDDPAMCTSDSAQVTTALPIVGITFLVLMGVFALAAVTVGLLDVASF